MRPSPALAALAFLAATPQLSTAATLTADPTTTVGANLVRIGNSTDLDLNVNNTGTGFSYDVYTGRYTIGAGDSLSSDSNIVGNTAEGVSGGSFDVGDDVFVIGWKATPLPGGAQRSLQNSFLKVNPDRQASYGFNNTGFRANSRRGDTFFELAKEFGDEYRVVTYAVSDGMGGFEFSYGGNVDGAALTESREELPFRTFGVNEIVDSNGNAQLSSQLILINVTDSNADPHPGALAIQPADIGVNPNFTLSLGGTNPAGLASTTEVFVPEPASAVAVGASGLLLLRRRRGHG